MKLHKLAEKKYSLLLILFSAAFIGSLWFMVVSLTEENQTMAVSGNEADNVNQVEEMEVVDVYFPRTFGELTDEGGNILLMAGEEQALYEMFESDKEPETHWGYTNLGIANVDSHLNIRENPSETGKLVGKLPKNAACEILDIDENGWAHVKSGKIEGYVSSDYLYQGLDAIAKGTEVATMLATVETVSLRVREQPNTESPTIRLVPLGEVIEFKEIENDWVKVDLDGEDAYISAEYVSIKEELFTAISMKELLYGSGVSNVRVDLVSYAKQFIGNPYVWGGTSLTKGADCSGFVLSVYKKFGISLPHSSRAQANCGKTVSLNNVKPGDLIFYTRGGVINHVAIYIGNGQVVHASSKKTGIKVSGMYYRTPYKAVSLLN